MAHLLHSNPIWSPVLTVRTQRDLNLLKLAQPLNRYARSLQTDPNAAHLAVHNALHAAFARDPRRGVPSVDDLKQRIQRDVAASC